MHLSTRHKAILALIITNAIWGAASPVFKFSLQNIPPFTLAFLRFEIAALLLVPFVYKEFKSVTNERKYLKEIILFSLSGVTVNIIFFFQGLRLTESINAPIITSSGPIFIIIFSIIFLKEKLEKNELIGSSLSFLGILLIVVKPILDNGFDGSILGNIFLLIATLGAVGQTLIGRRLTQNYPPLPLTFISFVIGSTTFIPFAATEIGHLPPIDYRGVIGIIFGAVFSSALAYSLFAWGLSKLEASETGLFTYIDPVVAIIIAYPLLGEKPDLFFAFGAVLVFLGIFLAEGRINYHPLGKFIREKAKIASE
jgi:drug/metabolite transporter (DMT)-like permease